MFDPHDYIARFASKDRMPGADTPGVIDGFLQSVGSNLKLMYASARKLGNEYLKSDDVYTSQGYMESRIRDERSTELLKNVELTGETDRLWGLNEEEKASFSWVRDENDFRAQEEVLLDERNRVWSSEHGDWATSIGSFLGGLVDPVTLVEFGAIGKGVGALTQFAKPAAKAFASWANRTFGTSLEFTEIITGEAAKKVARAAGHVGTTAAVYSYVKDNERQYVGIPVEGIGSNMAWNALLGACLGGVGGYVAPHLRKLLRKNRKDLTRSFGEKVLNDFSDSEVKVEWSDVIPEKLEGTPDIGAVKESVDAIKQTVSVDGESRFSKFFGVVPTVQGLTSKSSVVKKITDAFFRHQYFAEGSQGSISGVSTPVESEMTQWNGLKHINSAIVAKHGKEFIRRGYGDLAAFTDEYCKGMWSGNISYNSVVHGCLAPTRRNMNELAREAVKYGFLTDEQIKLAGGDISYLPRAYDVEYIREDFNGWEVDFMNEVRRVHPEYSKDQAIGYFEDVTDTIRGLDIDDIPTIQAVQSKTRVTKGRKVDLSSLALSKYLVRDPNKLFDIYFTGLGYQVAEKRVLQQLGYETFTDAYNAAKKEFHEISRTLSGEERNRFEQQAEKDLEFLKKIPKLITGQISSEMRFNIGTGGMNRKLHSGLNTLSILNSTTLLGKIGLSCFEDLAITASERGFPRHIGELWRHKFGSALEGFSKEELQRFGIAIESLSGNINILTSPTKMTKWSSLFYKVTGAPLIDDFRARVIASVTSQELAANILKGEKFTTRLNAKSIKEIRNELQKYAEIGEHGIEDMNISGWDSFDAKRDFMAEVERNVRRNIPNPGAGDVPPFFKSPMGKLLTMFMGWHFSLTNQVLLPLLRNGKPEWGKFAKLMTYGYGLAFLSNIIRGYIRGKPYNLDEEEIYKDSFLRMPLGMLTIPLDLADSLIHGVRSSQWGHDVSYTIAKMGNLRWVWDALDAAGSTFKSSQKGDWDRTLKKMVGVVPFMNLWCINPILNYFTGK